MSENARPMKAIKEEIEALDPYVREGMMQRATEKKNHFEELHALADEISI